MHPSRLVHFENANFQHVCRATALIASPRIISCASCNFRFNNNNGITSFINCAPIPNVYLMFRAVTMLYLSCLSTHSIFIDITSFSYHTKKSEANENQFFDIFEPMQGSNQLCGSRKKHLKASLPRATTIIKLFFF